MGIIYVVLICATILILFYKELVKIEINIKHTHTNEISESMIEYQKLLNKEVIKDDEKKKTEDIPTMDDVVSVVQQMWEGVDEA